MFDSRFRSRITQCILLTPLVTNHKSAKQKWANQKNENSSHPSLLTDAAFSQQQARAVQARVKEANDLVTSRQNLLRQISGWYFCRPLTQPLTPTPDLFSITLCWCLTNCLCSIEPKIWKTRLPSRSWSARSNVVRQTTPGRELEWGTLTKRSRSWGVCARHIYRQINLRLSWLSCSRRWPSSRRWRRLWEVSNTATSSCRF